MQFVTCPHCQCNVPDDDADIGQAIRCLNCDLTFAVASPVPPPQTAAPPLATRRRRRKSASPSPPIIAAGFAGMLGIAILTVMGIQFAQRDSQPRRVSSAQPPTPRARVSRPRQHSVARPKPTPSVPAPPTAPAVPVPSQPTEPQSGLGGGGFGPSSDTLNEFGNPFPTSASSVPFESSTLPESKASLPETPLAPADTREATDTTRRGVSEDADRSDSEKSSDPRVDRDLVRLVKEVEPAVVRIEAKSGIAIGSGFVADAAGIVFTNHHVVRGGEVAQVAFNNGHRLAVLGALLLDAHRDLAVLKVDTTEREDPIPALSIRVTLPDKGTAVAAFGAPLGLSWSVTDGIISGKRSPAEVERALPGLPIRLSGIWIQTTAAISHGNSGGPLVDFEKQVVGLNTLASHYGRDDKEGRPTKGENINFSISCLDLIHALEKARSSDVIPLPTKVAAKPLGSGGGGGSGGIGSSTSPTGTDWLQPVRPSKRYPWLIAANSIYLDSSGKWQQMPKETRAWGHIVGFTIEAVLVQIEPTKTVVYIPLWRLGEEMKTVGSHVRTAEKELRDKGDKEGADEIDAHWTEARRALISLGERQEDMDRQQRIATGNNLRPLGPSADAVYRQFYSRGIIRGQ